MKKLDYLLLNINTIKILGDKIIEIESITNNSEKVSEKSMFVAIKGNNSDGHNYIDQAIVNGAKCIVCQILPEKIVNSITYIIVKNSRTEYSKICSNFFDNPSEKLNLIGITGTNGKTTTATFLYEILQLQNIKSGLISTNCIKIHNEKFDTNLTTPDSYEINFYLNEMVSHGVEYCFMEVSSHSIVQDRIKGLNFKIGVFTNISHDHLNYHKTFKNYIEAKKIFFDNLSSKSVSLYNSDDKNGRIMIQNTSSKIKSFSIHKNSDYKIKIVENNLEGLVVEIQNNVIHSQISGNHNAYNLIAAYAVCDLLGLEKQKITQSLSVLESVEGRFEVISENNKIGIVDFAHTPDAIKKVLLSLREYVSKKNKLITIVGCGGGRDKLKRFKMGRISSSLSDISIYTSDNPRDEDPNQIIKDMLEGVETENRDKVLVIENREKAIEKGVKLSNEKDVVVVLGKGHEKYQLIGNKKIEFSDKEKLSYYLKRAV